MSDTRNKVLLYRTNKQGSVDSNIEYGELALNYNSETPFLMLKDTENNIQKVGVLSNSTGQSEYHTMTQKAITEVIKTVSDDLTNAVNEINTEIENITSSVTESANEVFIGESTPTMGSIELFIDESVDPISVEVYSKEEIDTKVSALNNIDTTLTSSLDSKVTYGDSKDNSLTTDLYVDTSANDSIEVYTRAQVDAIIAKLKADNNLI